MKDILTVLFWTIAFFAVIFWIASLINPDTPDFFETLHTLVTSMIAFFAYFFDWVPNL